MLVLIYKKTLPKGGVKDNSNEMLLLYYLNI